GAVDADAVEEFLGFYANACVQRGVDPLIENVPPVLRMRTGGVYLSPIGGHWRDLLDWRERVPELGFTIDTSHAALFRSFATIYPGLFAHPWDEELELGRYVEELGPHAQVAHVSDAHGLLGEGLPYGGGELELDPVVRRLGELVRFIVAEINEPDPVRSVEMKRAYRAIERALALPPARGTPRSSASLPTSSATSARRGGSSGSSRQPSPRSSSISRRTSTSTGPRSSRRSSSTRTCTARGTCCAPPRLRASRPSSSPRPTRPRSRRASTDGRSGSWSS